MEVMVTAKFRGEMPYEMHGLEIKLNDEDLENYPELITLQDRIDKAIAIGSKKCIAFGLVHEALTIEQAKNKAALVTQVFVHGRAKVSSDIKPKID
jgi:hypothetical protein